ncbi:hypothetical protein KP509_36G060100 [Ceratopteris richardii]|nr:hypothetical protein KP509_36G060100 [Ceratopteris richardii]
MYYHHLIVRNNFECHSFLQNLLVHFYCKCGALKEADFLFNRHFERDAFSWDFLMRAYVLYGFTEKAFGIFDRLQHEAFLPDKVLYSTTLSACTAADDSLNVGRALHARISGSVLMSDIVLRTSLLSLYRKYGAVDHAHKLFNESSHTDDISCNAMIETCVEYGHKEEAIHVYESMQWQGLMPNDSTFVSLLSVCVSSADLTLGKVIHVRAIEANVDSDVRTATALISMYGRCGDLEHSKLLFCISDDRDAVMWNALLAAYSQHGHAGTAVKVFKQMQQECFLPNRVTFVSLFQACSDTTMFTEGQRLHACITCKGDDLELVVGNTLITMYGTSGKLECAQGIFERLPEKNVVSWTAMVTACSQHGHVEGACHFLSGMHEEGIMPNEYTLVSVLSAFANLGDPSRCKHLHTWLVMGGFSFIGVIGNALITLYAKCEYVEDALVLFDELEQKDGVSWNALISGCAQAAYCKDALWLYEQMQLEGVIPESGAFASLFSACSESANLLRGQQIHVQVLNIELKLDDAVWNSIVNMYSRCGVIMKAYGMFNGIAKRNLASWNCMINGCAQHGVGERALHLLESMIDDGLEPDASTLTSVITACSHSGLADEGLSTIVMLQCLEKILTLDHLSCLIDAVGRMGRTAESWLLVVGMPFQPNHASHLGLLNACKHHTDVKVGRLATLYALELAPEDTASPVLMSNLYGLAGSEDFY